LPGEKVGVVGGTGSGKSTFIKLIERFYEPQAGSIMLDGKPIQDYDVYHLRQHMSVVAQDNMLFSTTIRENIIYGLSRSRRESITDAEIEDACRKANAWVFVNDFPRKLETYAGERGVKLSGGQKQRLAIARAIIRNPTIILLDEATSALDSKAEVVVKDALDKMIAANATGCTVIIAHRLSTVKTCDKIICMDKGSIKESGSHEKLISIPVKKGPDGEMLSGWYRDLWETQHGKATDGERLESLQQENAKLKEKLASLLAHALKRFMLGHAKPVEMWPRHPSSPGSKICTQMTAPRIPHAALLSRCKSTTEKATCEMYLQELPLQRSSSAPAVSRGNVSKPNPSFLSTEAAKGLFSNPMEVRQKYYW
jgi:ABC-type methionine transport system ATPase subunit